MSFAVPSDPSEPPSTPERRRPLDPIPSTTPVGPPPSASKSLFKQSQSRRPRFSPRTSKLGPPSSTDAQPKAAPSAHTSFFGAPPAGRDGPIFQVARGRAAAFPPSSPPVNVDDSVMQDEDPRGFAQASPGGRSLRSSVMDGSRPGAPGIKRPRQSASAGREGRDFRAYAKGIATNRPPTSLTESDDLIVGTEAILESLEIEDTAHANRMAAQAAASQVAKDLLARWNSIHRMPTEQVESERIGPDDAEPGSAKASFLASLLLPLHHPAAWDQNPKGRQRPDQSLVVRLPRERSIPELLLGWLRRFHRPGAEVVELVAAEKARGYAAAEEFWDAIMTSLVTGRIENVIRLLEGANFGRQKSHYTRPQLGYIDDALESMVDLLRSCPAAESDDWDVKGSAWSVFRVAVKQTKTRLRTLLRGRDGEAENINTNNMSFSLSRSSRMVESCLPQDIYDSLVDMCDMMLGDSAALINASYDWVEATIALTVWWDGEEDEDLHASLSASRASRRRRQSRSVDVTPALAYRERLGMSLDRVLEEDELGDTVDYSNALHVGLCCIFSGQVDGALDILKTFSVCMACATACVADIGGWLSDPSRPSSVEGLDDTDLMVLNYDHDGSPGLKDSLLSTYADLLAARRQFTDESGTRHIEGWELALMVVARYSDADASSSKASSILDGLRLDSNDKVDRILDICDSLGFTDLAVKLSERYGDDLAEMRSNFGDALVYYAKAHKPQKMKELLHSLITLSLVQSTAYPGADDVDPTLKELLQSPGKAVSHLNAADLVAGRYMSTYLSGYATVRKFYETRDEHLFDGGDARDATHQKRKAAAALVAVIGSAADSIRGGLLDSNVDVVIPVDVLLVLLGEAMVFVNQRTAYFDSKQLMTLLKAVEDLETVNPHVFARCDKIFRAAAAEPNKQGSSPHELLKKSVSSLTASSGFSMVGSSMWKSQILDTQDGAKASTESSGVLVKKPVNRGWDWRRGLRKDDTAESLLRLLRLALAHEMARSWLLAD